MPRDPDIEAFFFEVLDQYGSHVRTSRACNQHAHYPSLNLTNIGMPMLTERWATGPGQYTREMYHLLESALKTCFAFADRVVSVIVVLSSQVWRTPS
jgi:hypothetical protein